MTRTRAAIAATIALLCTAALVVVLALSGGGESPPSPPADLGLATAAGPLANGAVLVGSVEVHVSGSPDAESVRWVLDGEFLEKDDAAPFDVSFEVLPGDHTLRAKLDLGGEDRTLEVDFESGAGTPGPSGTPAPPSSNPSSNPSTGPSGPSSSASPSRPPLTAPAPEPTPLAGSNGPVVKVSDTDKLHAALSAAQPGWTIELADGRYSGPFVATVSGTAQDPIRLTGDRGAVLVGDGIKEGYTLHLDGASYWQLVGFTVTAGQKAIMLDQANGNVLDDLDIGNVGMEAVHFRNFSSDNVIQNSTVHDTGLTQPRYGEGIYFGTARSNWKSFSGGQPDNSDNNKALRNTLTNIAAEPFDLKEATFGGVIAGNTMDGSNISGENYADSYIDVKGNDYQIIDNVMINASSNVLDGIQTHEITDGSGSGNTFSGNVADTELPGFVINIEKRTTGNVVLCSNSGTGAQGMSNVACR